ncbi:hypothetical protein FLLO111716_12055 [Flavobacterium longum]
MRGLIFFSNPEITFSQLVQPQQQEQLQQEQQ